MQLTIDAGLINVWSEDQDVHLIIYPRRAMAGDPTDVHLRCAPMPLVEFHPENTPNAPAPACWLWNGSPHDATRICDLVHEQLKHWLRLDVSLPPRIFAWRRHVLTSLHLLQPDAIKDAILKKGNVQ